MSNDVFDIECHRGSQDWDILVRAWNQGIDSHLEAFTESRHLPGGGQYGKDRFEFAWSELPILLRRLREMETEDDQDALMLADDIEIGMRQRSA
jgi:hypothetical protein